MKFQNSSVQIMLLKLAIRSSDRTRTQIPTRGSYGQRRPVHSFGDNDNDRVQVVVCDGRGVRLAIEMSQVRLDATGSTDANDSGQVVHTPVHQSGQRTLML